VMLMGYSLYSKLGQHMLILINTVSIALYSMLAAMSIP